MIGWLSPWSEPIKLYYAAGAVQIVPTKGKALRKKPSRVRSPTKAAHDSPLSVTYIMAINNCLKHICALDTLRRQSCACPKLFKIAIGCKALTSRFWSTSNLCANSYREIAFRRLFSDLLSMKFRCWARARLKMIAVEIVISGCGWRPSADDANSVIVGGTNMGWL